MLGIRFRFYIAAISITLLAGKLPAQADDATFTHLAKIGTFAFGGIGIVGGRNPGEKDYDEILAHPFAAETFEKLFAVGTPEAKCFALVGLHRLNRAKFETIAETVRNSDVSVSVARGCILWRQPLSQVIHNIEAGGYAHH